METITRDKAASLLGVEPDADSDDVQRAWRVRAREVHPDVGGSDVEMAELTEARDIMLIPAPVEPEAEEIRPEPQRPLRQNAPRVVRLRLWWDADHVRFGGIVVGTIASVVVVIVALALAPGVVLVGVTAYMVGLGVHITRIVLGHPPIGRFVAAHVVNLWRNRVDSDE